MTPKKSKKINEKKVVFKGGNMLPNSFRLITTVFFLTYKGISDSGERLTKQSLADFLMKHPKDRSSYPIHYLVCQQMYDSGEPHFHVILKYQKRKSITDPNYFDFIGIHPNIQTMRNMKAALQYVYKQDPHPYTNMNVVNQKLVARAKDNSSLYELLEQQMKKDPFNFDPIKFCVENNLSKQIYKANYSKALSLIKLVQPAYCNKLLVTKPGFKYISRALIRAKLNRKQLQIFDSWAGYQTIVDHLNQIPTYRFTRPGKTLNLLVTGPPSIGKSALVWQTYIQPHLNPINAHCSVYPMGMKGWFPNYQSGVYDVIYWNQAALTSYPYATVLQLLDGSPMDLPSKGGGHKKLDNPLVIMTSNLTLDQMILYKFAYDPQLLQTAKHNLKTRITNVIVPEGYDLFLLQKLFVPQEPNNSSYITLAKPSLFQFQTNLENHKTKFTNVKDQG